MTQKKKKIIDLNKPKKMSPTTKIINSKDKIKKNNKKSPINQFYPKQITLPFKRILNKIILLYLTTDIHQISFS